MDENHHSRLLEEIATEYKDVLENSEQGIYIYLDDTHKICNEKFSSLLGYDSPTEWAEVSENFPTAFVDPKSQEVLINSYQEAMEMCVGTKIEVTWKKKSGEPIESEVILVPVSNGGHLFALHFVSTS